MVYQKLEPYLEQYYFDENCNCAETVLKAANEAWDLKLDPQVFVTMAGFGGGVACGHLCGAITGGVAAMGYLYAPKGGHNSPIMGPKAKLLVQLVQQRLGSSLCADLAKEHKTPQHRCIAAVRKVCDIIDEVILTEVEPAPLPQPTKRQP